MRIFLDTSVLIHWLNKTNDYNSIEIIRKYAIQKKIMEVIISPEVELEILNKKDGTGSEDLKKVKENWPLKICMYIKTHITASQDGKKVMNGLLSNAKHLQHNMYKITKEYTDSSHYATADIIEDIDYFLMVDREFTKKAKQIHNGKIVIPKDLVAILEKKNKP